MANTDRIEREIEDLAAALIRTGVTVDEAIRELRLNYAAQLEEIAGRERRAA